MKICLGVLFCILVCCHSKDNPPIFNELIEGKVVGITDGDTFTLLDQGKKQLKVRLYGIDCPEKKQDFGSVAKTRLSELIFGKQVQIEFKSYDRWRRTVANVFCDGKNVNELLLAEGLAWHFTKYDDNPKWSVLEKNAREKKLGLWSYGNPVPPWKWRRSK